MKLFVCNCDSLFKTFLISLLNKNHSCHRFLKESQHQRLSYPPFILFPKHQVLTYNLAISSRYRVPSSHDHSRISNTLSNRIPQAQALSAKSRELQPPIMLIRCRGWRIDPRCKSRVNVEIALDGRILLSRCILIFHEFTVFADDGGIRPVVILLPLGSILVVGSSTASVGLSVVEICGTLGAHAAL